VLVRLQTADPIRLAATVQGEQGATAAFDRTRIMRVAMGAEHDSLPFSSSTVGVGCFLRCAGPLGTARTKGEKTAKTIQIEAGAYTI
jgi:hypothetical protein